VPFLRFQTAGCTAPPPYRGACHNLQVAFAPLPLQVISSVQRPFAVAFKFLKTVQHAGAELAQNASSVLLQQVANATLEDVHSKVTLLTSEVGARGVGMSPSLHGCTTHVLSTPVAQ